MIYVLDQNYLRSHELRELVSREPTSKFAIPDIALLEMCKSDRWRETLLGSLETLSQCPGRVYQSMSVGEALSFELVKARSIEGRLLPVEFRQFLREVLRDVQGGGQGAAIDRLQAKMLAAQQGMQQYELNHSLNRDRLLQRVGIVESNLRGGPLKSLRNGNATLDERLDLIWRVSLDLCRHFLLGNGMSENGAIMFLRQKPMVLRFFLASVRHSVEWAARGGILTLLPERATNDILDQEYVLIGSYFDATLSKETSVMQADHELRSLLKRRIEWPTVIQERSN